PRPPFSALSSLFSCLGHPAHPHSFPTRRSSDLRARSVRPYEIRTQRLARRGRRALRYHAAIHLLVLYETCVYISPGRAVRAPTRSEEHTSELQSRFDLVCRLLLEKKNRFNNKFV